MLLCSAHTVRHRARRCARFAVPRTATRPHLHPPLTHRPQLTRRKARARRSHIAHSSPAVRLAPHSPAYAAHALPALSHARRAHSRTPSLVRRFSRAVPLAPSHLHPPSLVPPFLPHLRPHRAHGATPHDRPDAPLSRRSHRRSSRARTRCTHNAHASAASSVSPPKF